MVGLAQNRLASLVKWKGQQVPSVVGVRIANGCQPCIRRADGLEVQVSLISEWDTCTGGRGAHIAGSALLHCIGLFAGGKAHMHGLFSS